ncbi:MAG TPA: YciI family protein [Gemmatimonadaceae bacterium]|nr:YciI family protein [Gemmatimonadaceae bacterium]
MRYMCLIYDDENAFWQLSDAERSAVYLRYRALREELVQTGRFVDGSQLAPTHKSTTVRVRNGATQATDGPFAETREQLGGYILIEAKDLNEAIAVAARIPTASNGAIEVRELI